MSETWKQNTPVRIEKKPATEIRYQPIAPFGGISNSNRPENRRVGRACDECRRKKIKCSVLEGSKSCKNCISYAKGCTYNSSVKKRGPPRGYIGTLENRLKRIEGLISDLSSEPNRSSSTTPSSKQNDDNDDNHIPKKQKIEQSTSKKGDTKVLLDVLRHNNLSTEGRFISGHSISSLLTKMKLLDKEKLSKYDIDLQHNGNTDYFHLRKINSEEDRKNDQIFQLITLGIIQSSDEIQSIDDWILAVTGVEKSLADRLIKVYFRYIHSLLPVINKTAFLEEYRGIKSCFPPGPILNAIFGAAVRYVDNCKKFGDSDRLDGKPWEFPENLSETLFESLIIFVKGRYTAALSTIQAIVIAHNHYTNVENWSSGWLLNCVAVRMSQDIGLHRSSEGWDISQQEKETRRTVWWAVYILDRWLSSGTGRPLTIFDEDCDELYPSENVSLDEIMDAMTEKSQHLPRFPSLDEKTISQVKENFVPLNQPFLHLLKLSEILGQILQGLYTPQAKRHSAKHGSDAIVAYLDDALSKWRASLPPLLEISSAGKGSLSVEDHIPILSMSGLICLSYCTLLILLHRPFIEKQDTGSTTPSGKKSKLSSQSALTICTNAAIRIVEVSENMHYRDFLMVSWGFALYPVFTAALIHIYNSSNTDSIVSDVAKSNLKRALAVVDKLCLLSPMATNLGTILKKVISLSPVFVNDPEFMETLHVDKKLIERRILISKQKSQVLARFQNQVNTPVEDTISSSNSSVKNMDGLEPTEQIEELRNHWFPNNGMIQNPTLDDTWINQLYKHTSPNLNYKDNTTPNNTNLNSSNVPFIPSTNPPYTNNTTNNTDVYSIRQFGLNMNNQASTPQQSFVFHYQNPSIPLQSFPSQQYPQQPTTFKTQPPQPPPTLFDLSDFSVPYFYGPHGLNNSTSFGPNLSSVNNNNNINTEDDPSALFRNRPDNPFWNMPSSMEVDDWYAYLSPHIEKQHK